MPQTITIHGLDFPIPERYTAGHICSALEARVLQECLAERLKKNFSVEVERALDATRAVDLPSGRPLNESQINDLYERFRTYAHDYVLGAPRTGDPIAREARRIAVDLAQEELRRMGKKRSDVDDAAWDRAVVRLASSPAVRQEASTRVESSRKIIADALDIDWD